MKRKIFCMLAFIGLCGMQCLWKAGGMGNGNGICGNTGNGSGNSGEI